MKIETQTPPPIGANSPGAPPRRNTFKYMLGGAALLLLVGILLRHALFSTNGFMPHGHCYFWDPRVVYLHVISDGLTALAYFTIPFTLVYLVNKRRDLSFDWIFLCFAIFIVACGMTHVMEIISVWRPFYWLSGAFKAITALASVPTAILLWRLLPQALALPSPSQLQKANEQLAATVTEQRKSEEEVKRLNASLEQRVRERTAELTLANERLQILARETAERERRQHEFALLTQVISATSSELEAARQLANTCTRLFTCDAFSLDAYHARTNHIRAVLTIDTLSGRRQEVSPAYDKSAPSSLVEKVLKEGPKLILREPAALGATEGLNRFGDANRPSASLMFVPVRSGNEVLGVLSVQSYKQQAYKAEDLDLLQIIADLCAGAMNRIRTEAELHAQEEQYHQIVETTQEGIWMTDIAGRTTFVNGRMGDILGYAPEEMMGRTLVEFMLEEDRAAMAEELAAKGVFQHNQRDLRLCRADGATLWVLSSANPLHDTQGEYIGTVAMLTDITERKNIEDDLRESEGRFQAFMSHLPGVAFIKGADGRYLYINQAWKHIFDLGPEKVLGRRDAEIFPPDIAASFLRSDDAVLASGEPTQIVEMVPQGNKPKYWLSSKFRVRGARPEENFVGGIALDITSAREAEVELHEMQERFMAFMGNLSGVAFIKDGQSRYVFVNAAWEKLFGRKLEQVRGLHDADLFPASMAGDFGQSDHLLRQDRKPLQVVETFLQPDGPHSYLVNKFLIPGETEGEDYVGGIAVDITERLRTQQALRESQARSQAILASALDAVITIDQQGRVVEFNPAAENMFGYKNSDIIGEEMALKIIPEEMRAQHRAGLMRVVRTGESHILGRRIELTACRADGSRFPAELTINRVEFSAQPLFTGFIRDITERKAAESAVRLSEERYRVLVSATASIVWSTNPEGQMITPQPTWEAYTGQSWEDTRQHGTFSMLHEEDRAAVIARWEQTRAEKKMYVSEARYWHAASQSWHYCSTRGVPLLNEDGTIREWIGTITDIDAQKRAEFEIRQLNASLERRVEERTAELQTANKELESFCYSVSHDLRAPLRAIDGFSQALEEDYATLLDNSGRNYLQRVRNATKRMAQLIDDLLELSRVTRAEINRTDVDLSQLAAQVMEELQHGDRDRRVAWEICPGLRVHGDPRLLRVVLDNLLGNAWKFTKKQPLPKIEMGVILQDGKSVFYVRDNGAGFDMNYASKLFGAFQRLHSATDYEGTGVGLANVQRVIHRHGGRVWAEAKPGEGATFYFTLPEPKDLS